MKPRQPLLEIEDVSKSYRAPRGHGRTLALDGVSLQVGAGEVVAVVGPSGSGKSTLARCALRLEIPDRGAVRLDGEDLLRLRGAALLRARRRLQIVFQDPGNALDPRMPAGEAVLEGLRIHGLLAPGEAPGRLEELFRAVGLDPAAASRLPHRFSAGERQRLAIARALAVGPELLVLDEPVAALDPPVQAAVLGLLSDLRERRGLALLLISHDLALVARLAGRIVVLAGGRVVESGATDDVLGAPSHEVTRRIVRASWTGTGLPGPAADPS